MIVIGAGGFAKQLVGELTKYGQFVFYDDVKLDGSRFLNKFNVISSFSEASNYINSVDSRFVLGIGSPKHRRLFSEKFRSIGGNLTSVISPQSSLSDYVSRIGNGVTILQSSIIEADACIGEGCLINIKSLIAHDSTIGDYCEISPGALILGNVTIGENCLITAASMVGAGNLVGDMVFMGLRSTMAPNISIGDYSKTAIGTVLANNVGSERQAINLDMLHNRYNKI